MLLAPKLYNTSSYCTNNARQLFLNSPKKGARKISKLHDRFFLSQTAIHNNHDDDD